MPERLRAKSPDSGICPSSDSAFQRIRSVLFYLSLIVFFGTLPFILSFALGYKFNSHTLKFVKTGLIYIKTQPEGASIYINGRLMPDKSPASIQELLPGVYKVALKLAKYYSWRGEIDVEAGKVSKIDKVILFPFRPNLEQLNRGGFSLFRAYPDKGEIYYLDEPAGVVYKSGLNGDNFEDVASLPDKFGRISGWDVSPDREKLFIFNSHQIGIISLDDRDDYIYADSYISLDYPREGITAVFWHSDSYHLIVLTDRHVAVVESRPLAKPVNLVELNKEPRQVFYDNKRQEIYFSDAQRRPDGTVYSNLYRLQLSPELYLLERLIKRTDE